MGKIKKNLPVKLVCGMLFRREKDKTLVLESMRRRFGPLDFESESVPFTQTGYYDEEMGSGLLRKFISFGKLIAPDKLASIKLITNSLEDSLSTGGRRRVNLDPGYLELAKLVLASTKDFSHRIYLGKGIYAELTLFYRSGAFRPLEWTYPDYRTKWCIETMDKIRRIYYGQVVSPGDYPLKKQEKGENGRI